MPAKHGKGEWGVDVILQLGFEVVHRFDEHGDTIGGNVKFVLTERLKSASTGDGRRLRLPPPFYGKYLRQNKIKQTKTDLWECGN